MPGSFIDGALPTVSEALQTTLDLLASTKNEAAVPVLVPALDSPIEAIRVGALRALLDRRSHIGQREVLARLHRFGRKERNIISEKQGRLSHALRMAVLATDAQMMTNGFQATLWLREYELVPALVNALEDRSNPHRDEAARTLLELSKLLYTELAGQRDPRSRRDPQMVRRFVVNSLERSVGKYNQHENRAVVEAFLILATRENATLKKILNDPHHGTYLVVIDLLTHSEHGGVIRLLLSFLDDPFAPMSVLRVIAARSDKVFVRHLMAKVGDSPATNVARNLKRLDTICWANGDQRGVLDDLDEHGQCAALAIALASGMKRLEVFNTVTYMLSYGKPAARRAAARALAQFQGADANRLALEALDDQDPGVQAEIVRQLRHRGMPGALQYQIDRLDSPHEIVRQAARESLSEFSFVRFLAAFDTLDDGVRQRTGMLVRKVDPDAPALLLDELSSRSRGRRLRALQVAEALDMVREVEHGLIALLGDEDHVVRVEAARLLAKSPTAASIAALRGALLDKSALVQQAAERSLLEIGQQQGVKEQAAKAVKRAETGAAQQSGDSVRETTPPAVTDTTPISPRENTNQ